MILALVAEADWICEAIVENLKIKQDLMARIDEVRKPNAIVTTNTSGIPVTAIAEGRSEGFQTAFPGHAFLQPAALSEAAGDHSHRRTLIRKWSSSSPGSANIAWAKGIVLVQGHAQFHRQPCCLWDGRVRHGLTS